jgi:hypothetical protein
MEDLSFEAWKASPCEGKRSTNGGSGTVSTYDLCRTCCVPDSEEPCAYAPRGRCASMKENEPTASELLKTFQTLTIRSGLFKEADVGRYLHHVCDYSSQLWSCSDCQRWALRSGRSIRGVWNLETAYTTTHNADCIARSLPTFCSSGVGRTYWLSDEEKDVCYPLMKELTDFLHQHGVMNAEDHKDLQELIEICHAIRCGRIHEALSELQASEYWKKLEEAKVPASEDENGSTDRFDEIVECDYEMKVEKVTKDGWVFEKPVAKHYNSDSSCPPPPKKQCMENDILVRLPPAVALLGRDGMHFTCMNLGYRGGVWTPFHSFGEEKMVCANVYPPLF